MHLASIIDLGIMLKGIKLSDSYSLDIKKHLFLVANQLRKVCGCVYILAVRVKISDAS